MAAGRDVSARPGWLWGGYARDGLWAVLLTVLIDQAHKVWMIDVAKVKLGVRTAVTPFLDIVYVLNTGISYSLFDQKTMAGQYVLASFAVLASLALWIWLVRGEGARLMAVSLGLIIGGALANAVDRVRLGGVADFFSLHAYGFYWYIFNIADVAIVAGVIGLLYDAWRPGRNDAAKGA